MLRSNARKQCFHIRIVRVIALYGEALPAAARHLVCRILNRARQSVDARRAADRSPCHINGRAGLTQDSRDRRPSSSARAGYDDDFIYQSFQIRGHGMVNVSFVQAPLETK
jgi:hypothetical protein